MQACPYDALYLDPETHTAAKCHFCAHRVEVGLKPACEIVCPEEAIISGDLDDPNSRVSQLMAREVVQVRKPEQGTYPKLFYINADDTALTPGTASSSNTYMWAEMPAFPSGNGSNQEIDGNQARKMFLAKLMGEVPDHGEMGEWERRRTGSPSPALSSPHAPRPPLTARTVYDVGHPKPWGGKISLYIWTKSLSAGTFLLSLLLPYLNLAPRNALFSWGGPLVALIFLLITTGLLIRDLKRPERFFYILTKPQWRSWLTLGSYILVIYGFILAFWIGGTLLGVAAIPQVLFWPGVLFAILSVVYTGFLFGQAEGRDFWQNPLMPAHLTVQAVLAGAAMLLLFAVLRPYAAGPETRELELWSRNVLLETLGWGLLGNAFMILVGELLMRPPNRDVQRALRLITAGPFKFLFWGGGVLAGSLLPLSLILAPVGTLTLVGLLVSILGVLGVLSKKLSERDRAKEERKVPFDLSPFALRFLSWGSLILLGFVPLVLLLSGSTSVLVPLAAIAASLFSLGGLLAFEHVRVMAGQSVPLS